MDPNRLTKLTVTDVRDGIPGGAGSGDTIYFTYDGVQYRFESWSTDNSSGSDVYQASERRDEADEVHVTWGPPLSLSNGGIEELAEYFDETVLPIWWDTYREIVTPAVEKARRITVEQLAGINA